MVSARLGIPGVHAHHARGLAARRSPPPCRAQGLADGSTGGRGAAARAARPSEGVTVSRRVEAHASALSSADASLDAGDAAVRPRFLPWCRSAQAETRALNYALNGSALALVLVASATELAELVRGDFFSAHAGLEAMRGFLNQGWEAYAHAVDSHPVSTKACISGVVYGLGDLTAPTYEQRSLRDFDAARIARSALCGLLAHGPLSHLYYEKLDRFFILSPYFDGGDAWYTPLFKIVVDQSAWSVAWNSLYYVLLGLMKLESPAIIYSTVRASWWSVLKAGWRLWPMAHLVTYTLIPRAHRVLWVDTVELAWVTILAHYGHQQRERAAALAALAAGTELRVPTQVACALPGASFTEEILRSMDGAETELVFSSADGDVVRRRPADVYAEAAAAAAASAGDAEAAMRAGHTSAARDV